MPPFDNSMIKDQVLSWLHDEETTVTAQKIQQECVGEDANDGSEMGVSRKGASDLLRGLYENKPKDYTATVCNVTTSSSNANQNNDSNGEEDIVQTTVFSWQQLEPGNSLENTADSTILALSKSSSAEQSPLEASHEQDMNTLRDRLFGNADTADHAWFYKHQQLCHVLVNPLQDGTEATAPAVQEEKTWHKVERTPIVRPKSNTNSIASAFSKKPAPSSKKAKESSSSSSSNSKTITKVKPTTAKSFFTQKPAAKSGAAASKPKAKPVAKPSKSNDDDDGDNESQTKKSTATASKSSAFAKRVRPTPDKENTDTEDQHNVGNADDFVGDEDEDSEDELDMEQRREKSKEIVRKQKKQDELLDELVQEQQHDMEEEKPILVRGAMDAFATKTSSPKKKAALGSNLSNKKRRKVLKEKTTVDKNGYLVTTTETIWEDCSSDEEDVKKKAMARPTKSKQQSVTKAIKKKKATDMRQGSLMGFFKPKAK